MIWLEYLGFDTSRNSIEGYAFLEGETDHSGITITLSGPEQYAATTDSSGYYYMAGMQDGTYALSASKDGYMTETSQGWTFEPAHHTVNFALRQNS